MQWLIASIKRLLELYIEKVLKNKLQIGAIIVKRIVDGVIKAIEKIILEPLKAFFEFMNLITQILAKAGGVLDKILGHPVRFIKNLFSGVKGGLSTFVGRMGIHLERGLQSFLFGPIAETGIEMPKTIDSSGLLTVVGQLSGLSYDRIRERATGKLGEEKVAFLEGGASAIQSGNVGEFAQEQAQGYADNQVAAVKEKAGPLGRMGDIFQVLKKGPGGLIKYFQELDFNSLIMGIMGEIKEYLIQEIVQKAVIQVVSYLTPGAGWLKAAIDALKVMYALFIERAQQVKEILDGFTDSVVSIAKQAIAPAIKRLDGALGKSIPVLIGVLADYLGIGGIPQKIQGFLKKGQKWVDANVMPIIDKILDKVAAAFAKLPSMNVADYIPKGMGAGNFYAPLRKQLNKVTKKPFENLDKARTAVNFVGTAFKPMGLKSLNLEPADSQGKTFNVIAMKPLPGRQLSPVVGRVNTVNHNSFKRVSRRNSNSLSLSPKTNVISRNSISAIQRSPVSSRIQSANSKLQTGVVQSKPNVSNFVKQKSPLVSTISPSSLQRSKISRDFGNQKITTQKPIFRKSQNNPNQSNLNSQLISKDYLRSVLRKKDSSVGQVSLFDAAKQGIWNLIKYTVSFAKGLKEGFIGSLQGLVDLIFKILETIFFGDIGEKTEELWESIKNLKWENIKQAVGDAASKWIKELTHKDPVIRGKAHGKVVGYLFGEAALAFITGGASLAGKLLGKFASKFTKQIKGIFKKKNIPLPNPGLANRGYRPEPKYRSTTKEEWKKQQHRKRYEKREEENNRGNKVAAENARIGELHDRYIKTGEWEVKGNEKTPGGWSAPPQPGSDLYKARQAYKSSKSSKSSSSDWVDEAGNIKWPPNRGFVGTPKEITLKPGTRIDRYGFEGGTFLSPEGTPYAKRALAPGTENKPYNVYEVIKPLNAKSGEVAPWFDQPGGGIQYELDRSVSDLLKAGIIKKIAP